MLLEGGGGFRADRHQETVDISMAVSMFHSQLLCVETLLPLRFEARGRAWTSGSFLPASRRC